MFLHSLITRNPSLVGFARTAHQQGALPPDCYVIDLDRVLDNASVLTRVARAHDVELFQVCKQFGRNPAVLDVVGQVMSKVAAIDYREALIAASVQRTRLGNVGHLVQIPRRILPAVLRANPEFVTVYDTANLLAVGQCARQLGRTQDVLLKVASASEDLYPGQEGGYQPAEIPRALVEAERIPNIRVRGLTGFPCFLFDPEKGRPRATATALRIADVAKRLDDPILDLPSHTSASTIPMIAELGGRIGEPGHALTGTTPQNAVDLETPEVPAILYLSEVAQEGQNLAIFGGGFYPRGHAKNVTGWNESGKRWMGHLSNAPAQNIDYYRQFTVSSGLPRLSDTAIMSFRTQIFVTRSLVAPVAGLATGDPHVVGLFDSGGNEVGAEGIGR